MANLSATLEQARRHFEAGRLDQARMLLSRAARTQRHPAISNALATVLTAAGQFEQAAFHARSAAQAMPTDPWPRVNLGKSLSLLGRMDQAEAAFREALSLAPDNPDAAVCLATLYRTRRQYSVAADLLANVVRRQPDDAHAAALYVAVLPTLGRADEAADIARQALVRHPDDLNLASLLPNVLNYVPGVSREDIFEAHKHFGRVLGVRVRPLPYPPAPDDPERPLRVGLLSHDLRRHSVGFFLESLLQGLDRSAFTVHCYSTSPTEDDVSKRFAAMADQWRHVANLDDRKLAEQIRADQIDVLIETSGHTRGYRLGVMAMRPAPLQATFLGYPNTTGVPAIDFRIVDSITDPPGAETYCVEHPIRLDPCFLCYTPQPEAPGVQPPPSQRGEPITFGSFNTIQKLNGEVIKAWSALLRKVEGSRLVLKAMELQEEALCETLSRRFADAGIDAASLTLLTPRESMRDHLESYGQIDIALDTFPYTGATTTLEALWMGVPVVTLRGQSHAERVGASILTAAGLEELITDSTGQYIDRAAALAADGKALQKLRTTLRERIAGSVLCDARDYSQRFGRLIRDVWQEACGKVQA